MKKLAIAILVVSLLIAGVTVGVSAHANNPKTIVRNSFGDIVEDLAERDEVAPIINVFTKGSVTVDASVDMTEDEKIRMGGKVYFSEDEVYFENLHVKAADIKLDSDLYFGKDYMYLTNDKILGGTYGVVYSEIVNNFKKSIFAPDSDSEFAISEEEFDEILNILKLYTDEKLNDIPKDVEKIYDRYVKVFMKSLEEHANYESEKGEVKVGGDYMRARTVTVTVSEKTVVNIIKDLYKELKEDDDLRDKLKEYSDYFASLIVELGYAASDDVEDFDIEQYYDDAIDSIGDAIETMEENMQKFKLVVKFVTPTTSSTVLKIEVYARVDGEKIDIVTVDFGKGGIKKSDCIRIESNGIEVKYEISENNSKEYSSSLKVSYGDGWMTIFKLFVDKKEDTYRITTPEELGNVTIRGTFEQKGDKTTIGLNKIKIGEQTIDGFNIKITLDEKDSLPKIISKKNIKDVVKISEKDIERITENLEEFMTEIGLSMTDIPDMFEEIFENMGDISGGIGIPGVGVPDIGDDYWNDDYWGDESYWDDDESYWDDDESYWDDDDYWGDDGWG
ncbi:MAG: hypothetical protein E7633_08985 [Ruminococcaceae bacterium]|nr:hypothetical protein [Oscillospiraceae bacterium]